MPRLTISVVLLLHFLSSHSQQEYLVLKKRYKTIFEYWPGTVMAVQLKTKEWQKGEIVKIKNDSILLQPKYVQYSLMHTDTILLLPLSFTRSEIYAFPKKGVRVDYVNGSFRPLISGSHVKWYWIKGGKLFRYGGAGYAGLNIINSIIQNDLSFSKNKTPISIGGSIFLGGVLLHKLYSPVLRLGKKYHVEMIKFSK